MYYSCWAIIRTANLNHFEYFETILTENKKLTKSFKELLVEPIGALCDIAPTVLDLMDIKKPEEMTGISLLNSLK